MSVQPYNFSLPDVSPIFHYLPFQDGPLATSWNVSYSQNPESSWTPEDIGAGTSAHNTTLVGASVELRWIGTAVFLYGTAPSASYSTTLDDRSPLPGSPLGPNTLAAYTGLSYGPHSVSLNLTHDALLSFTGATFTAAVATPPTQYNVSTISHTIPPAVNTSFFDTGGTLWYAAPTYGPGNQIAYPRLGTQELQATLTFSLQSTSAFAIVGSVNYDQDAYTITVTPSTGQPSTAAFNASSRWADLDVVKYLHTGMDSTQPYTVRITNLGNGSDEAPKGWFDISKVVVYTGPPAVHHRGHLPVGAIVGIAIGAVLALLLALSIPPLLVRRLRKQDHETQMEFVVPENRPGYIIDISPRGALLDPSPTPPPASAIHMPQPTHAHTTHSAKSLSVSSRPSSAPIPLVPVSSPPRTPVRTPPLREVDAGPIPPPPAEPAPPQYDAAWADTPAAREQRERERRPRRWKGSR